MNIIFWILVIAALVLVWFALSVFFESIGETALNAIDDVKNATADDMSEENFEIYEEDYYER